MSYSATDYPYDTVCFITDSFGLQGSGVLVSADFVLTAAHLVWDYASGRAATSITVSPGYNDGPSSLGSLTGTAVSYFEVDDSGGTISNAASQQDFALIHLTQPVTGAGYMGVLSNFGGGAVTVTGYPASSGGAQYSLTETAVKNPVYSLLDISGTSPGSSGGPVWVTQGGKPYVVGIVSSGGAMSSYAGLIGSSIFTWIANTVAAYDGFTPAPVSLGLDDQVINAETIDMYRFFDVKSGGHFFTTSLREESTVLASADYKLESNDFGAINPTANDAGATDVYRFFDIGDGGHLFTTSTAERDNILQTRPDLRLEGIAFQEYTTQQAGTVAVYRFFDKVDGGHFFTADASETKAASTNPALTLEGIAFYAPAVS